MNGKVVPFSSVVGRLCGRTPWTECLCGRLYKCFDGGRACRGTRAFFFPPATGLFPLVCSITMALRKLQTAKWLMLDSAWPVFRWGTERKRRFSPFHNNCPPRLRRQTADRELFFCGVSFYWSAKDKLVIMCKLCLLHHFSFQNWALKKRIYVLQVIWTLSFPSCVHHLLSCHWGKRRRLISRAFFPFYWRAVLQREPSITWIVCASLLPVSNSVSLSPSSRLKGQAAPVWPQEAVSSSEKGRRPKRGGEAFSPHPPPLFTHSLPQNDPWPFHLFISEHGSEK